jgi:hypothetical protein
MSITIRPEILEQWEILLRHCAAFCPELGPVAAEMRSMLDQAPPTDARLALLAWVGKDENHDKVGIRSVGTPMGVIPACVVDNDSGRRTMQNPRMLSLIESMAAYLQEPQRLVRFTELETVREALPNGGGTH